MTTTTAEYCNGTAFVFVPNLCNAKCSFCYVHPSFATRAVASTTVINRAESLAESLCSLGFNEVRFTGGEPTIFQNLGDLITPFIEAGLHYRILTNGINTSRHESLFRQYPPARFTLSAHDVVRPTDTFEVPLSPETLRDNRRRLSALAEIEASVVVTSVPEDFQFLDGTLEILRADGVSHIKLILENSLHASHGQDFTQLATDYAVRWSGKFKSLRITDVTQMTCKLAAKGFPAVDLGTNIAYACCVQVHDKMLPSGYSCQLPSDAPALTQALQSLIDLSRHRERAQLPCATTAPSCPLAIKVA